MVEISPKWQRMLQRSCTGMAILRCCSNRQKRLCTRSGQQAQGRCRTLSAAIMWWVDSRKTKVSRTTAGKGWSHVKFENHGIEVYGNLAFAMGHYFFTGATSGVVAKVEYTFCYKRTADGKARIFVHH